MIVLLSRLLFILMVFYTGTVCAERLISKDILPYRISDIGGCKIISLAKHSAIPYKLRQDCKKAPIPDLSVDNTWHDYYSSIELSLGDALAISLRSVSKSLGIWSTQLTKGKDIHVVLYHDYQLANAGVAEYDDYILIVFNDGLIELIENTVSALEMASAPPVLTGVNFVDWLELMRTPRSMDENTIISAGPDRNIHDRDVFYPPTWFLSTRIRASTLYQFIIGHELAHIYRGDLDGSFVVSLKREISCDKISFDAFFVNNDEKIAMSTILPFFVSLWYYEKYWRNEIRNSRQIIMSDTYPDLFARNWNERAKRMLDQWQDVVGNDSESKAAKKIYSHILFSLRSPFDSTALVKNVQKKITLKFEDVKFHRPPKDAKVDYSLFILNSDKNNPIKVVVEVQSRVFNRDGSLPVSSRAPKDYKGRHYQVVDNKIYTVTVPPKGRKMFTDTLPWIGTKVVYPGIAKRIVAADYAN